MCHLGENPHDWHIWRTQRPQKKSINKNQHKPCTECFQSNQCARYKVCIKYQNYKNSCIDILTAILFNSLEVSSLIKENWYTKKQHFYKCQCISTHTDTISFFLMKNRSSQNWLKEDKIAHPPISWKVWTHSLDCLSHSLINLSSPQDTTSRLSGENLRK